MSLTRQSTRFRLPCASGEEALHEPYRTAPEGAPRGAPEEAPGEATTTPSVTLDAHVHLKQPDLWRALLPAWPLRQGTLDGSLHLRADAKALRVEADVRLRLGADSLTAEVQFPVSLTRFEVDRPRLLFIPIADTIRIDARLRAALDAGTPPPVADTTAASPPPNGATRPQG